MYFLALDTPTFVIQLALKKKNGYFVNFVKLMIPIKDSGNSPTEQEWLVTKLMTYPVTTFFAPISFVSTLYFSMNAFILR